MDSLVQGLSRSEKKKKRMQITISKIIASVQFYFLLFGVAGVIMIAIYLGVYSSSMTVSSSAQGQAAVEGRHEIGREMLVAGNSPMPSVANKADKMVATSRIVVNVPSRTLDYYNNNQLIKTYSIAVGKPSTPTPLGSFVINNKEVNPWWYPPRRKIVVPSGPSNPLGYRWMGFAPLYGIHGTNAPWEVGGSVSNGCVRMFEEDVEELFELVPYGTSVNITYDRVRVITSNAGKVSLGIYPDVYLYNKEKITVVDVQKNITMAGLQGLVSDAFLQEAINQQAGQQVAILQIHKLKVNNKILPVPAIVSSGRILVPVWPVVNALGIDVIWDEKNQLMGVEERNAHGTLQGETLYLLMDDIQRLFGGMWLWQQENNCWELVTPKVGKK